MYRSMPAHTLHIFYIQLTTVILVICNCSCCDSSRISMSVSVIISCCGGGRCCNCDYFSTINSLKFVLRKILNFRKIFHCNSFLLNWSWNFILGCILIVIAYSYSFSAFAPFVSVAAYNIGLYYMLILINLHYMWHCPTRCR